MCKIYNNVGSLTTVKLHLHQHRIADFSSLNEVIAFQTNYSLNRRQIISEHERLIVQEKNDLESEISLLDISIKAGKTHFEDELRNEIDRLKQELNNLLPLTPTNFIQKFRNRIKGWYYKKKIRQKELNFDSQIAYSIRTSTEQRKQKDNRYQFIVSNFEDVVKESCLIQLKELERKKIAIDEVNTSILGALGEHKVVKELEKLSNEYFLVNDFSLSFPKAIYNRKENDYIKSIQIDHILVSPAGIFLIETKNWSDKSLNNLSLHSPVQQIKRTSFVLFKLLTESIADYRLNLNQHHWGNKKVPIKNLIVLTNTKLSEEFQYVKVLTLTELLGYIKWFKPVFSNNETEKITNYLLNLPKQKF